MTSTPKKKIAKPPQPMSSPLPALTSSPKAYETKRDNPFPAIPFPAFPKRHTASQHSDHVELNTNNKRIFISPRTPTKGSDEEGRKLKKARTLPLIEASPSSKSGSRCSAANLTPLSVTRADDRATASTSVDADEQISAGRIPNAVPTLTELLASARKSKKKRPISNRASGLERKQKDEPPAPAPEPRPDTRALDPTESADEGDFFNTFSIVQNLNNDPKTAHSLDVNVGKLPFNSESEIDQLANDVDLDLASPTKSLSSIAASDDEVEDEVDVDQSDTMDNFVLNSSFRPLATSTQVQPQYERPRGPFISKSNSNPRCDEGNKELNVTDSWASLYAPRPGAAIAPAPSNDARGASGPSVKAKDGGMPSSHPTSSYGMYNSQFESAVAAHVEKVDKLLEKDIDFEMYAKALYDDKRTNLEEEGGDGDSHSSGSLEEGSCPNGLSYGYGKAFDYEQSF